MKKLIEDLYKNFTNVIFSSHGYTKEYQLTMAKF